MCLFCFAFLRQLVPKLWSNACAFCVCMCVYAVRAFVAGAWRAIVCLLATKGAWVIGACMFILFSLPVTIIENVMVCRLVVRVACVCYVRLCVHLSRVYGGRWASNSLLLTRVHTYTQTHFNEPNMECNIAAASLPSEQKSLLKRCLPM